ncbi:MAG: Lrp/AsnC ligand binding domain-containing protein [Candidatus Bathyarchaeota archaeon]|nr:MAG: Lrp/AsnC ligand binding domain-containing protein [Candidatus Bathyarchaeota archaeon]
MEAYILLNTRPDVHWKAAEDSLKINGVKTAHAVTGPYDVLIHVVFENIEALGELIRKIHAIEGVERTQTAVVVPPRLH